MIREKDTTRLFHGLVRRRRRRHDDICVCFTLVSTVSSTLASRCNPSRADVLFLWAVLVVS